MCFMIENNSFRSLLAVMLPYAFIIVKSVLFDNRFCTSDLTDWLGFNNRYRVVF